MKESSHNLRAIPSVDRILRDLGETGLPRAASLAIVRRVTAAARASQVESGDVMQAIRREIEILRLQKIQPILNGTGVILHTNFGRAPLGSAANLVAQIATQYSNLEFDLSTGQRGSRAAYLEHNLAVLCNAPAATVVNNCAAALVLMLRHFTSRAPKTSVIISRGELIQIGGGFRIPEILQSSGATLREIGTTNKTSLDDYGSVIDESSAMILRVHRSNFYMDGFVESPTVAQIAAIARDASLPFVVDLGSGAMFDTLSLGNEHEPTPAQLLDAGADLVCFSGDKLLGGPQAGIIAGKSELIAALKAEPFFRALRCDKLVLSALQETVDAYLGEDISQIPSRAMMTQPLAALRSRAEKIIAALADQFLNIVSSQSQIGGGALPRTTIDSIAIEIKSSNISADALAEKLRRNDPPIVGYIAEGAVRIDLRTIFAEQDAILIRAITSLLNA